LAGKNPKITYQVVEQPVTNDLGETVKVNVKYKMVDGVPVGKYDFSTQSWVDLNPKGDDSLDEINALEALYQNEAVTPSVEQSGSVESQPIVDNVANIGPTQLSLYKIQQMKFNPKYKEDPKYKAVIDNAENVYQGTVTARNLSDLAYAKDNIIDPIGKSIWKLGAKSRSASTIPIELRDGAVWNEDAGAWFRNGIQVSQ